MLNATQRGCSCFMLLALIFFFFMLGAGLAGVQSVDVTPQGIQMIMPDGHPAVPYGQPTRAPKR